MAHPRRKAPAGTAKWIRGAGQAWSELELARLITQGIPTSAVNDVVDEGVITREEVTQLIVRRRTLAHRKRRGEKLSRDESDRFARVLHLYQLARRAFDDDGDKVRAWLRTPNRALSGDTPLALVVTSAGARLAEDVLLRIEHGVYS